MLRTTYKDQRRVHSTMITTRTTALIATIALLGSVAPAAFAQNTSVNQDNDEVKQKNDIDQYQASFNSAEAGGDGGSGNDVIAGNNAAAVSFQNQEATATNTNSDDDRFTTTQVDLCAFVAFAFIC
jgi:hypothetical protein